MERVAIILAMAFLAILQASGQTIPCKSGNKIGDAFELKGFVTDSHGPLGQIVVIVFPLSLPKGDPVTRYWYGNTPLRKQNRTLAKGSSNIESFYETGHDGPLTMSNEKALTAGDGSFTVKISTDLFLDPCQCTKCTGYKQGEVALGVFRETTKGRFESVLELEPLKFDPDSSSVDAGRIVFRTALADPVKKGIAPQP